MSKKENTRKSIIKKRNSDIREKYRELYDKKRIRHDDCIEKLAELFYLTEDTINRILSKA